MSKQYTLITGRTTKQGGALHHGRDSEEYRRATGLVEMNSDDMAQVQVKEGQLVRVSTVAGEVDVPVIEGNLPPGMLFMPLGPVANRLIGVDTQSTGMPLFKGMRAEVELV